MSWRKKEKDAREILLSGAKIRIYDFDFHQINFFTLHLFTFLADKPLGGYLRYSAGGKGLHLRTPYDLTRFQCENRQYWSEKYGYDITWITKKDGEVTIWTEIGKFLSVNFHKLIGTCLLNVKYPQSRKEKFRNWSKNRCLYLKKRKQHRNARENQQKVSNLKTNFIAQRKH